MDKEELKSRVDGVFRILGSYPSSHIPIGFTRVVMEEMLLKEHKNIPLSFPSFQLVTETKDLCGND